MSVYVSDFGDGTSWTVIHDDFGHTGTVDPTTVQYIVNMDGTENHNFLVIVCPVCGDVSTHPVGGGAQPESVQQMFVRVAMRHGASRDDALADVQQRCAALDGPDRWRIDESVLAPDHDA